MTGASGMSTSRSVRVAIGTGLAAEGLAVLLNCGGELHNTQAGLTGTLHLSYRRHHNLLTHEYLFRCPCILTCEYLF